MADKDIKSNLDTSQEEFLRQSISPIFSNVDLDNVFVVHEREISEEADKKGRYTVTHSEKIAGPATTAVMKLFDTANAYLTADDISHRILKNDYGDLFVDPEVQIPLIAYGEANGFKLRTGHFDDPILQAKENIRAKQARKDFRNQTKKF